MTLPLIILVGGFLGAGKTSLILGAAQLLKMRGMRVAVITNDQDTGLVDTRLAEASHLPTREVAGGCFCCRFSDLLDAAADLQTYAPDVIFAEPVGSCIDLSATILQPLKAFHAGSYRLAPLTVLFDPDLADCVYQGAADADTTYLFRNQITEADILCATKSDLHPVRSPLPFPVDFFVSARTLDGVDSWLREIMAGGRIAGSQLLQVDYERYAQAEVALGWLNLHARVTLTEASSPAVLTGPLLEDLAQRLSRANIRITHLKIFDRAASGYVKAAMCANSALADVEGELLADPELEHELAINLRAIGDPAQFAGIVADALAEIDGKVNIQHQKFFRPPPPTPEHRFGSVVYAAP